MFDSVCVCVCTRKLRDVRAEERAGVTREKEEWANSDKSSKDMQIGTKKSRKHTSRKI